MLVESCRAAPAALLDAPLARITMLRHKGAEPDDRQGAALLFADPPAMPGP
jgi:hypothetical protein